MLPNDDKEAIDTKTTHLMTVSQQLGEKVYAASQAEQAGADSGASAGNKANDDDVVDAEVKEVKKD